MSDTIETAEVSTLHLDTQPVGDLYLDDFDEDDDTPALTIRNGSSHVYVITGDLRTFADRVAAAVTRQLPTPTERVDRIALNDALTPLWSAAGLSDEAHDDALNELTHLVADFIERSADK